jgi:WD40 repeat protein/DNA-binding SARP family transcriptional activator
MATFVGTEVRILGPVELWRDGEPVHVGGPRQRALLVLLALRANEVVSSERLVAELFGADAPETSTNAVQAAVSRLRRLLEPGALETRGGGYVLHVDAGQLDSSHFERLLAEGRAQLAGGDAAAAASTLREALSLWRGSPLGDLGALEFAQADARRLDELRVVGLTDRIEAELELGAAQQLVPELEGLVAENPLQERLRGQLMLALYRCGRQADALAVYRETRQLLREELGLEPSRALQDLERAILRQDVELEPTAAAAEPVVLCPFKGLAAFGTGDAAYFFGRERLVDEVIARLVDQPFVGLVGSSGSGKSSLLHAGVVAALAAGALPGSITWRRSLVRPGAHPLAVLPEQVDLLAVDQLEEAFTTCRDEEERAAFFAELARCARGGTIVLVALRGDFYGRCGAYPEFASLLSSNHVLLGAMHRDELAHAIGGPAQRAGLQVERELVELLVDDVAGEPGALPLLSTTLVELWRRRTGRVLTAASYRDSGGVRGAVARLAEHAFGELNEREQRAARAVMLRLADEEEGAVVRRRVPIEELDVATNDDVARAVGVLTESRLVTVAEGTVEVSHESLLAEWPRLRAWLDEDRAGRRLRAHLATSAREWDERGREPGDLYRGPRLGAALDWSGEHADQLNALEREFLEAAHTEHERELAQQRRRNRRLRVSLAGVVVLLALAVAAGVVALVQRHYARRQATVALARQLGAEAVSEPRIDLAMLLARQAVKLNDSPETQGTLLATLLRSPAVTGTMEYAFGSRPQRLALSPDGRSLAVSDNENNVRVYDTATHRVRETIPDLGYAMPVAFTSDGKFVVGDGGKDGAKIDVRRARTFALVKQLSYGKRWVDTVEHTKGGVGGFPLVFVSKDDRFVYQAWDAVRDDGRDGAGYVDRWNIRTGQVVERPLDADGAQATGLSSDGRRLVVIGLREATVVDTRTLQPVRHVPFPANPQMTTGAVSPDGRTIALGTVLGTVSFVDLASGRVWSGLGGHGIGVVGMAFSPNGRTLVTAAEDGSVIEWDVATGAPVAHLVGHASRVLGIAFGSDGRTLYTCSLDGAIFAWDLGTAHRFGQPFADGTKQNAFFDADPPPPLAISGDGRRFADRLGSGAAGIFSLAERRLTARIDVPGGMVDDIAWSPTAPLVAVTGGHGTVQLWDVRGRPRLVRSLRGFRSVNGQRESGEAVAFSHDGRVLVAGDVNHTPGLTPWRYGSVAEWSVATGRLVWLRRNRAGWVHALAFSPDDRTVAVAQEDGNVRIRDARTGRLLRSLPLYGGLKANVLVYDTLAYRPDGVLATGTWGGIVQLWNTHTGAEIGRPTLVAQSPVSGIAFNPHVPFFATTGGSDGLGKLWSTSTLQQFGANFPREPAAWGSATFTPDGSRLLIVWDDGHAVLWPTTPRAWEQHACFVAGRRLTHEEWSRFVGGRAYRPAC